MCGENSRGHAARDHLQGEEQRCAGAQRSRAGRFARRSQSADAIEAQQAAARTLAGVAGHDLGGKQARQPLAAEQSEGYVSVAWRKLNLRCEMNWRDRITIDPAIHHGDPCIKGTRVPVSVIAGSIADGDTPEQLLAAYPQLTAEDIRAALKFAAEAANNADFIPLNHAVGQCA